MLQKNVLVAPDLPAEGWWSMNYYWNEFQKAMGASFFRGTITSALPNREGNRLVQRHWSYPRNVERLLKDLQGPKILHVLDHSYGHLCRSDVPTVVSCHDLAEWRTKTLPFLQHRLWKWRVDFIRNARYFLALSESTSSDLQEFLGIPKERIIVNPFGVDERFQPLLDLELAPGRFERLQVISQKKREEYFLLLHVGSNIERKNIRTLLKALEILKQQNRKTILVKAGESFRTGEFQELIQKGSLEEMVFEVESPCFDELRWLYSFCDGLSMPSTYEGQGLPVLEAQACGLPCVISNSTSLTEVGGEAALYHEALDANMLAMQVIKLMDSEILRNDLRMAGFKNVKRFTWKEHFSKLGDVYQKSFSEI